VPLKVETKSRRVLLIIVYYKYNSFVDALEPRWRNCLTIMSRHLWNNSSIYWFECSVDEWSERIILYNHFFTSWTLLSRDVLLILPVMDKALLIVSVQKWYRDEMLFWWNLQEYYNTIAIHIHRACFYGLQSIVAFRPRHFLRQERRARGHALR